MVQIYGQLCYKFMYKFMDNYVTLMTLYILDLEKPAVGSRQRLVGYSSFVYKVVSYAN
jgi:hypothetical protein